MVAVVVVVVVEEGDGAIIHTGNVGTHHVRTRRV